MRLTILAAAAIATTVSGCGMFDNGRQQSSSRQSTSQAQTARASEMSPATVRQVQARLNQLGFNAGSEDGMMSDRTRRALLDFQQSRNIQADGVLGPQTFAALGIDASNSGSAGSSTMSGSGMTR